MQLLPREQEKLLIVVAADLASLEHEVYELLGEHDVRDDTDNIEIEPIEKIQFRKCICLS